MQHSAAGVSLRAGGGGQQGVGNGHLQLRRRTMGTDERDKSQREKLVREMLRAPFQEVNPLVFSLGQTS